MAFGWINDDPGFGAGFVRIATEQIERARAAADGNGPTARRIHEARRRCKKLRALLRAVRPDFPGYEHENARIRDAASRLAEARDAHVMQETLGALLADLGFGATATPAMPAGEADAREVLARFGDDMRDLLDRVRDWPIGAIHHETIEAGLVLTYKRGRIARRDAGRNPTDTSFHEWRKLGKYHWYQLELLGRLAPHGLVAEIGAVKDLTEELGTHHDLCVLETNLQVAAGADADLPAIRSAITGRKSELEDRIWQLGDRVYDERPRRFRARIAGYLKRWPDGISD
ncbi:MAG: CHAD domain-containing protein [Devosia sp.]|nr:CHAD domain-containing protein [Devosia sp.]